MKIEKVIRGVSSDGTSVLNAAVAANIGETGKATAIGAQHVEIVQRSGRSQARQHPTEKES